MDIVLHRSILLDGSQTMATSAIEAINGCINSENKVTQVPISLLMENLILIQASTTLLIPIGLWLYKEAPQQYFIESKLQLFECHERPSNYHQESRQWRNHLSSITLVREMNNAVQEHSTMTFKYCLLIQSPTKARKLKLLKTKKMDTTSITMVTDCASRGNCSTSNFSFFINRLKLQHDQWHCWCCQRTSRLG